MARTSGPIGMPTQTGTHALVVGWNGKPEVMERIGSVGFTSGLPVTGEQSPGCREWAHS